MPRSTRVPTYRLHKQSGQAVVTLRAADGSRRDVLLGKHDTPESRAEYARVIAEWNLNGGRIPQPTDCVTVAELLSAFWDHALDHYRRPDGSPTSEIGNFRLAFRPVKEMYAHMPAADFGPVALRTVRARMVEGGAARRTINKWTNRVRHVFKWGASACRRPVCSARDGTGEGGC
jgi:hypothetical protein